MAVVWFRESPRDRNIEFAKDNGGSASRSFLVRVDDPTTSISTICSSTGVTLGDLHPDDGNLSCDSINAKSSDDSGLLYTVTVSYKPSTPPGSDNNDPGSLDGLIPFWSASSSVTSEPIFTDVSGAVICNSAGDPLEGLEAEKAQFHLTYTRYYASHAGNDGWLKHSREYTNRVNDADWNGGAPGTWKCQGSSAKLNIDRQGEGGAARVYWEVTYDFAYRPQGWDLKPWDIGFNELVDENGNPAPTPGISSGSIGSGGGSGGDADGPCQDNLSRRAIRGQDGKPVRQPVALQDGVAKPPCLRPDKLEFVIYGSADFFAVFGEVRTPQA